MNSPLDRILANACASHIITEGDPNNYRLGQVAEYLVETHCVEWRITAKLVEIEKTPENKFKYAYDILEMIPKDN